MIEPLLPRLVAGVLLVVGVIHIAPAIGLLGATTLHSLYGTPLALDAAESLLLRHRAVLFGVLGVGLALAAFRPDLHGPALVCAVVSVASFLWLARGYPALTPELMRVARVDVIALGALLLACVLHVGRRLL